MKVQRPEQTWKDVVRDALAKLGGEGHLRDIYRIVRKHPKRLTNRTWQYTIRRVVRQYAIFQPVPPKRSGVYRLVDIPEGVAAPDHVGTDHGVAQGMLLALGRLYGYETFSPVSDRTTRTFQGQPLSSFTTVADCSEFCRGASLNRVQQIDAIWLVDDNEGFYPAYAFEVEHTTRVRSGLDRLVEIPERFSVRLFVVAPGEKEQSIFDKLIVQNRFRRYRPRLVFRDYKQLETLYNAALTHQQQESAFGVEARRNK